MAIPPAGIPPTPSHSTGRPISRWKSARAFLLPCPCAVWKAANHDLIQRCRIKKQRPLPGNDTRISSDVASVWLAEQAIRRRPRVSIKLSKVGPIQLIQDEGKEAQSRCPQATCELPASNLAARSAATVRSRLKNRLARATARAANWAAQRCAQCPSGQKRWFAIRTNHRLNSTGVRFLAHQVARGQRLYAYVCVKLGTWK